MKEICLIGGVFMTSVTLKRNPNNYIDVYADKKFVGLIDLLLYRLKYSKYSTAEVKYYTIEKRD